ncbi:ras-related and estrogen-regulated growth inhibitor-like protein [Dinothrombium tinctorium]|uniref:small monomeric GTPase n=1 Tax=Dinothrombium tinctorium TaxID=1965070 RepID=A0A443RJM5_9ACAR|nr:ras-related and estrogen-regulated growth inhibitor-like protein [Dinothrombium tinctorium]RWS15449.1 ras-related and estrogen-regulated growth inhibitor-like protein [Dinothrombium tinctorium]RWS15454.1 ras-related and estrogen-regulated growth inhibitor-like protein [Dinothrombium tinctorium]
MSSNSPTSAANKVILKRKKSSLSEIKITVLGDRNVGKSAIVVRFLTKRYIIEYEHGIDNRYRHEILIDNEPVIFDILDISSPSSSSIANFDASLCGSDILLLVYSITDRPSFCYIRTLLRHIAQLKATSTTSSSTIPLVAIVGNKNDLIHLRQVSSEEGEILCTEYSELTTLFVGEVSAAEMLLHQMFVDLYKWVKKSKAAQKAIFTPSLLDRVVIGIKGSTSNGSS